MRPDDIDADARGAAAHALAALRAYLQPVRARVEAHAALFRETHAAAVAAGRPLLTADLALLAPALRASMEALGQAVDGMGIVAAPGVLGDAPMCMEWWRRGADGPRRLRVSLEPDEIGAYLYDERDWFRVPRETGRVWVMGPFVDHGGTNAHICSLQEPVVAAPPAATFLGVAGADLPVGELERAARRALADVPAPAALVNYDGRAIGGNTPQLASGALLDEPVAAGVAAARPGWSAAGGAAILRDAELPWSIVLPGAGR